MAEPGRIRTATTNTGDQRRPYQTPTASVRSNKSNTEAGLSRAQRETLQRVESSARSLRNEQLTAIDKNGNVFIQKGGNQSSVALYDSEARRLKDSVLTHNHPGAYYDTLPNRGGLAGRIGSPLSAQDVVTSVKRDVKEIRAITKGGYLYSLKRPSGGWGVSARTVSQEMRQYQFEAVSKYARSDSSGGARLNVVAQHDALRRIARKHGWTYTRRRVAQ